MPSWIPGSYLLREFARHVVAIEARDEHGAVLPLEKIDHRTWSCRGAHDGLAVTATIYALDLSVRGAWLDRRRGYFNGPCVFLLPESRDSEPIELVIEPPGGQACASWRVATAMQPADVDERGFGLYRAADYDELIDHPVEMSDSARVDFAADDVPHRLVIAGRFDSDLERVARDVRRLCEAQIEFFGRPPPFRHYWFLGLAVGDGYGGLEHRASSSLMFNRMDLPRRDEAGMPRDYQRFLALVSHEYFHTWHVKRTRPAAFVPYRLEGRNHTRLLWVFEGITTYYQDLFLLRAGLIGVQAYLQRLGEVLTRVYRSPGRLRQSAAQASFDAWDVLYKPEPNSPNASISYYAKGALVALALDLTLRAHTELTLDAVVLELWRRYGERNVGVPEDGFEALVLELCGTRQSEVLRSFFERAVHGTEDLPLAELLRELGVVLRFRAATGGDDPGGAPSCNGSVLSLGIAARGRDEGLELTAVLDDGAAQSAGLEPGDVLIALDRLKVGERNLAKRLARLQRGKPVAATVFRGDELLEVEIVPQAAPTDTCWLLLDETAAPAVVERRNSWLGT